MKLYNASSQTLSSINVKHRTTHKHHNSFHYVVWAKRRQRGTTRPRQRHLRLINNQYPVNRRGSPKLLRGPYFPPQTWKTPSKLQTIGNILRTPNIFSFIQATFWREAGGVWVWRGKWRRRERGGWGKESLGWRKKSEEREKVEWGRGAWEQEGEVRGWCGVVCWRELEENEGNRSRNDWLTGKEELMGSQLLGLYSL